MMMLTVKDLQEKQCESLVDMLIPTCKCPVHISFKQVNELCRCWSKHVNIFWAYGFKM